jgi:hypothetical protein
MISCRDPGDLIGKVDSDRFNNSLILQNLLFKRVMKMEKVKVKVNVKAEIYRRIDENFDEIWGEYTYLKKCVTEHGGLMLTAIKKDQKELAYNCYGNINYIIRVLTSTHSPLKNDILLQDDLVKLCENYAKQYPSDFPQPNRDTC